MPIEWRLDLAAGDEREAATGGFRQVWRPRLGEVRQVRLATPPWMPLTRARTGRGNRFQDVWQQGVGSEAFSQHRKPVAPDPRVIVAGEADHHEWVVPKAERRAHRNRMGTWATTSRVGLPILPRSFAATLLPPPEGVVLSQILLSLPTFTVAA